MQSVVIIVDTSLSTTAAPGGKPLFEDIKAKSAALVNRLPAGSEILVLPTVNAAPRGDPSAPSSPPAGFTENARAARRAIAILEPNDLPADFTGALARARIALANAAFETRNIFVVTDGQTFGWPETTRKATRDAPGPSGPEVPAQDSRQRPRVGPKIGVSVVPVGPQENLQNLGIVAVNATPALDVGPRQQRFEVNVRNFGNQPAASIDVLFERDGRTLARGTIQVPAQETVKKTFIFSLPRTPPM